MAVDKEAIICLSRVYSYYSTFFLSSRTCIRESLFCRLFSVFVNSEISMAYPTDLPSQCTGVSDRMIIQLKEIKCIRTTNTMSRVFTSG